MKVIAKTLAGIEAKDLRSLADDGKKRLGSGVVILVTTDDQGKAAVVVGVTDDLTGSEQCRTDCAGWRCESWAAEGAGAGPDMAQGGGPNGSAAPAALAAMKKLIKPAASA